MQTNLTLEQEIEPKSLNRKCTLSPGFSKRRSTGKSEGISESSEGNEAKIAECSREFHPLHPISVWIEPNITTQYVSVAIFLSSGVEAGNFLTHESQNEGMN